MSVSTFPYPQPRLENDLVLLEPFDPDVHIKRIVEQTKAHPDFLQYSALPSLDTEEEWREDLWNKYLSPSHGGCCYAVFDKHASLGLDGHSNYAGLLALVNPRATDAAIEIAIMIFPAFQKTHVTSNTIGITLLWLLDPPAAGGLGLRRVAWQANAANTASRTTALRMGFEFEGISRWHSVFPGSRKVGLSAEALRRRNSTVGEIPGKHTANYSIVWDEWEEKRPRILALMERKA